VSLGFFCIVLHLGRLCPALQMLDKVGKTSASNALAYFALLRHQ
jgi:hypothetical protein